VTVPPATHRRDDARRLGGDPNVAEIVEREDRLINANVKGPTFDYPIVSPAEMRDILDGTGWQLAQTIDSDDTYVAVLEKYAG
jgi:hypothetical protein